ncbi:putative disease resistance protein RGA3 [Beta vulgaris subsp. vulgaris]|uniref:putative disease resistance protein RGA3 n=1 Tax=Beta vulgaris subsp. vulgaris TaxID=3555 RepID=UPI00203753D3|nr:putative disease resistance protein RGA3 [Beta vulgaris subsp. vulgaris]
MNASVSTAAKRLSGVFNLDIQSRIDDITERLQDIQARTQFLGLSVVHITQQQPHQTEAHRSTRESTSLLSESEGGIGKTTLAQYVYNNDEVTSHFDWKAWVCVSDLFDVKRITTIIINSVTKQQAGDYKDLNQAQEKLKELVVGKKFIIVLDDIWSEKYEDWERLQVPFKQGGRGSRVIATTRIEKIAKMMMKNPTPGAIIRLKGLSNYACWRLFLQHANEDSELVEMRGDIVRKCNGLPLAAKALGGLFRTTVEKSRRQWILDSNI